MYAYTKSFPYMCVHVLSSQDSAIYFVVDRDVQNYTDMYTLIIAYPLENCHCSHYISKTHSPHTLYSGNLWKY